MTKLKSFLFLKALLILVLGFVTLTDAFATPRVTLSIQNRQVSEGFYYFDVYATMSEVNWEVGNSGMYIFYNPAALNIPTESEMVEVLDKNPLLANYLIQYNQYGLPGETYISMIAPGLGMGPYTTITGTQKICRLKFSIVNGDLLDNLTFAVDPYEGCTLYMGNNFEEWLQPNCDGPNCYAVVNPTPQPVNPPTSIVTGNVDGQFCQGDDVEVSYTITGTYNTDNVFTLQLSDATGSFASPTVINTVASTVSGTITGIIPVTTPEGNYKFRVVSSNPVVTGTESNTTNIHALPTPVISGLLSVCANSAQEYTVNTPEGTTNIWTVTGGTKTTDVNNAISVLWGEAGFGTISVIQTNANGCENSQELEVIINPMPDGAIAGPEVVCANSLSEYSFVSNGVYTYNWEIIGGTGTSTTNTILVDWNGVVPSSLVKVTVTTLAGCTSVYEFPVTVNPYPVAVVNGDASVCLNATKPYTATEILNAEYEWTVIGGTFTGTGNAIEVLWDVVGQGTVSLDITNNGCTSHVDYPVTVHALPQTEIIGAPVVCANSTVVYTATLPLDEVYTYEWAVVGGTIGYTDNNTVEIDWLAANENAKVQVAVTCESGCVSTFELPILINANPEVTISGIQELCIGTETIYTATEIPNALYVWTVTGGDYAANNNTVSVIWDEAGQGNVSVEVILNNCVKNFEYPVLVNSLPAAVIIGSEVVCANTEAVYSVEPIIGGQYTWSVTGGTFEGIGNSITVVFDALAPIHEVGVRVIAPTQCFTDATKSIIVNPMPTANIEGPATVCAGSEHIYFTNFIEGATYTFNVMGGTFTQNNNEIQVTWNTVLAGNVSVTVNNNGCEATDEMNVAITPMPAPVVTGPINVYTETLYTYSVNPEIGVTYEWLVNGIPVNTNATEIEVTFVEVGNNTIEVVGTNGECETSYTLDVNVTARPTIEFTGDLEICAGEEVTYTAITPGTNVWEVVGGETINQTINSITVLWSANGSVKLTQTNGEIVNELTKQVVVNANPVVVITGIAVGCEGFEGTYSVALLPDVTYNWSIDGIPVDGLNQITKVWNEVGTHSIELITINSVTGCTSSDALSVVVNAKPVVEITGLEAGCEGFEATYTVAEAEGVTYNWTIDGIPVNGLNQVTKVWNEVGTHVVAITVVNSSTGCMNSDEMTVTVNAKPVVEITGIAVGCEGFEGTYSVALLPDVTYNWTVDGIPVNGLNQITKVWNVAGTHNVEVLVVNNLTGCTYTDGLEVVVQATPSVPVIAGDVDAIENTLHTYTVSSLMGVDYTWTIVPSTAGTIQDNNGNEISVLWNTIGNATINVTKTVSATGCSSEGTLSVVVRSACDAPTVAARNLIFSNTTVENTVIRWTRGNGNGVLVLAQEGTAPFVNPTLAPEEYVADNEFGEGSLIGNAFVVYNGTDSRVNVIGLTPGTQYSFKVIEYRNDPCVAYNNSTLSSNPRIKATRPLAPVILPVTAKGTDTFVSEIEYTGNLDYFEVMLTDAENNIVNPDWWMTDIGTSRVITIDGLTPETSYLISYITKANGMLSVPVTSSIINTLAPEPAFPTEFTATMVEGLDNTAELTWNKNNAEYAMLLGGTTVIPNGEPVDGYSYTAGEELGNSTILYIGDANSVIVSNLAANSTLNFKLYTFNGTNWSESYQLNTANYSVEAATASVLNVKVYAPTELSFIEKAQTTINVNWIDVENTVPVTYIAEVYEMNGAIPVQVIETQEEFANFTGLTPNSQYVIMVKATFSGIFSDYTTPLFVNTYATVPQGVTNTTLSMVELGTMKATWNTDAQNVVIAYGTFDPEFTPNDGVYYSELINVAGNAGEYYLTNLPEGRIFIEIFGYNGDYTVAQEELNTLVYNRDIYGEVNALNIVLPIPTMLEVTSKTNTSFVANWEYPLGGSVDYFVLNIYNTLGETVNTYNVQGTSFDVTGLEANTEYGFAAKAIFAEAQSEIAEPLFVNTYATVPAVPPTDFTVVDRTETSVLISWTNAPKTLVVMNTVTPTFVPAPDTYYEVGTVLADGSIVVLNDNEDAIELFDLTPNTTYHFALFANDGNYAAEYQYTSLVYNTTPLFGTVKTRVTEPQAPTAMNFTDVTLNTMNVNWTKGTDAEYTVVFSNLTGMFSLPIDGTIYEVGQIVDGATVIYVGDGSTVSMSGLEEMTNYYFAAFSFNGNEAGETNFNYSGLYDNHSTTGFEPPSDLVFSQIRGTSVVANWVKGNNATHTIILRNTVNNFPTLVNYTNYTLGQVIDGATVAFLGTEATNQFTGLVDNTTYYFAAYSYIETANGNKFNPAYYMNQVTTLQIAPKPLAQDRVIMFQNVIGSNGNPSQIGLRWSYPTALAQKGQKRIAVIKPDSAILPYEFPVDGNVYTANTVFGNPLASKLGNCQVIYNGTNNGTTTVPVIVTNLVYNKVYYFRIYAYNTLNNDPNTASYLTDEATFNPRNRNAAREATDGENGGDVETFFTVSPIYPNPVKDVVNFTLNSNVEIQYNVEIYSADGKLMPISLNQVYGIGNHTVTLPLKDLSSGAYLLKVSAGDDSAVQTFIIAE